MNHEIIHKDEINHYGFQMTAKLQFVEENDLGDWIPYASRVVRYCAKFLANSKFLKYKN